MNGHDFTKGLNANSYISLGLVAALFIAVSGGGWWLSGKFNDLNNRIDRLERVSDRWSYIDMWRWTVRLQSENKQIKVPEPEREHKDAQ